jgi:hypothetical protein
MSNPTEIKIMTTIDFQEWLAMDRVCKAAKKWLQTRHPTPAEEHLAFIAEMSLKHAVEAQSGAQE